MNLWRIAIEQLAFGDVAAFCAQKPPPREGLRLDFKLDIPSHLERLLAGFANTVGGIIILGVGSNDTNEPVWPPAGIDDSPGIAERIRQIANEAVDPPVP